MINNFTEKLRKSGFLSARGIFGLTSILLLTSLAQNAFAQDATQIAENLVTSVSEMPAFVAGLSYLLGLSFGVWGVFKIKDHVETPTQTPIRAGIIRLLVGGGLLSLPMIYEVVSNSIGNDTLDVDPGASANLMSGVLGAIFTNPIVSTVFYNANAIMGNLLKSISGIPGLIAGAAYLLAIVIGVQGLLKTKDHVENPEQNPLKEAVIRYLVAGALFSLPTIYNAMFSAIGGSGISAGGVITSFVGAFSIVNSGFTDGTLQNENCFNGGAAATVLLGGGSLGDSMCASVFSVAVLPAFLTTLSYLIGLILGLWGVFKIRDHVLNPQQTPVWDGVARFVAGGAFFALPIIVEISRSFFTGGAAGSVVQAAVGQAGSISKYRDSACVPPAGGGAPTDFGLDSMLGCFMGDIMGPLHIVLNFFAFAVGMIFIMIGIYRLTKSAQEGARGPGGMGTVMTFLTGGALISYNELVRAVISSFNGGTTVAAVLGGGGVTQTYATLEYTDGLSTTDTAAAHSTITAILQFVIIVGLISFVRGIFIVRSVAEGNQQASMMAAVTHLVGGALAINLGPLLNAVQSTLGIGAYGLKFS